MQLVADNAEPFLRFEMEPHDELVVLEASGIAATLINLAGVGNLAATSGGHDSGDAQNKIKRHVVMNPNFKGARKGIAAQTKGNQRLNPWPPPSSQMSPNPMILSKLDGSSPANWMLDKLINRKYTYARGQ